MCLVGTLIAHRPHNACALRENTFEPAKLFSSSDGSFKADKVVLAMTAILEKRVQRGLMHMPFGPSIDAPNPKEGRFRQDQELNLRCMYIYVRSWLDRGLESNNPVT